MHGNPLSPRDNRELWKKYKFKDFGIIGEAYLSIDFNEVSYFTDTGGHGVINIIEGNPVHFGTGVLLLFIYIIIVFIKIMKNMMIYYL